MNPNLAIVDEYHQHKPKPKKCYNCKHAGNSFKIAGKTHMHCCDEKQYNQEGFDKGDFTPWDTLREFWNTCENHEHKTNLQ